MLSVFGGVFEKGSLAQERNSFTFLSGLARTSLACSLLRSPHLKSVRHSPREKHAKSPGLGCFVANSGWCRGPRLGLCKETRPLC